MYTYYKLFYNICQQYFWYTSLSINSCEYLYSPFKKIIYFFSIFLPSNQEIKYIYYTVLSDYLQDYKKSLQILGIFKITLNPPYPLCFIITLPLWTSIICFTIRSPKPCRCSVVFLSQTI